MTDESLSVVIETQPGEPKPAPVTEALGWGCMLFIASISLAAIFTALGLLAWSWRFMSRAWFGG